MDIYSESDLPFDELWLIPWLVLSGLLFFKEGERLKGANMMKFDVCECIRNYEFREYFRTQELKVWEQIQIVLHSYASIKQKREWLSCLLKQVKEENKQEVQNMIELIDTCLCQIYQTEENVIYVAEYMDTITNQRKRKRRAKDVIRASEFAELTFHDDFIGMTEHLENTYLPKPDDVNREMYIYQIIKVPHKKHRIKLEFSMTWIEGRVEIFNMFPDKEWLERKGISEETIDDFEDEGICYKELPFKKGDRLKIKTPLMKDYLYGTITWAECDGNGCWYYFFMPDGRKTDINSEKYDEDMICMNYHEIDMTSGYSVFDWVERA